MELPHNISSHLFQDDLHEGFHEKCNICDIKLLSVSELREHNKKNHAKVKKESGSGQGGMAGKNKKYLYDKISKEVNNARVFCRLTK